MEHAALIGVLLLVGVLVWVALQVRQLHADLIPLLQLANSPLARQLGHVG